MKKFKYLFAFLLVLTLLIGCTKKEEKKEDKKDPEPAPVVDETLVKINNLEFHLTKESSFDDIKFITAEEFKEARMDTYVQYNYLQENSKNLLFYRIFHYKNSTREAARDDLGIEAGLTFEDGKNDNLNYGLIDLKRTDGTAHFYFINKDSDVYVVNFMSQYDIKDFENKVIKSLKF
jgi:hypothetical protein